MSLAPPTRPSLLLRVRDPADDRAWREFVDIYTPLVFGFARRRGLQDADAADVAQEVMRALARTMQRFEYRPDRGLFRSWLFTVTRSKFNNFLEAQRRHPPGTGRTSVREMIEAQPCREQDESWDEEYQRHLLRWACDQVKAEFQEPTWRAFWLTAVEGRSGKEVASVTGMSVGAVYIARSRVTARIRDKVRETIGEPLDYAPVTSDAQASAGGGTAVS
jgi:RNA polymerase sigma factor (sigma-70 family)